MKNISLNHARKEKNDEFYTRYEDIEQELSHYTEQLKDKVIYCNCDDYRKSNFVKYFRDNFNKFQLKKLIATHYLPKTIFDDVKVYRYEKTKDNEIITELNDDGSFMSDECISVLEQVDIVITNPPFSLFSEFISLLEEYNKHYLIVGNPCAIFYKTIFNLYKENKIHNGYKSMNSSMVFDTPNGKEETIRAMWFTNLKVEKETFVLPLTEKYDLTKYKKYDNFDAIEIERVKDIPYDYDGVMGVPCSFLDKYNPDQFEILGRCCDTDYVFNECSFFTPPPKEKQKEYRKYNQSWRLQNCYMLDDNGNPILMYARLFIKRK